MRKYNLFRGKVSKLGENMAYTGTPAGNKHGTCVCECNGCYAQSGNFRFPSVRKGLQHIMDGLINERDKVFEDFQDQINKARKKITLLRIHHSGDFIDLDHLLRWLKMAVVNPQIKFYTYTKRYDLFRKYFASGEELPENFTLNISIWKNLGRNVWNEFKTHRNVNCFVVDLDKKVETIDAAKCCRCPYYDINGKMDKGHTCDNCGLCMSPEHLEIHCWKH